MSIGPWRALLNLSAKLVVNSVYSVRTSQVQQVVVAVAIVLLPLFTEASEPQPGTLISEHEFAKPDRFIDWEFAKSVWWELETRQQFDAEWNKYAPEFEPWLAAYKENSYKAMKALKDYPADKRQRILRGHDMQLAFDDWWNHTYSDWYHGYKNALRNGRAKTFEEYTKWARAGTCSNQRWISQCGAPDWRDQVMKADDQAMMQKAGDQIAVEKARRK
jgi:hypothetical protein